MNSLTLCLTIAVGIASIWVYFDADRFKAKGVMGANDTSPLAWAIGTFLFFIFAFPFYLIKRAKYERLLATPPGNPPPDGERPMSFGKQLLHGLILFVVLLGVLAIIYYFFNHFFFSRF